MRHEIKIWPQYFERVADGSKTFEVRENGRGYQPGDDVVLYEWDPTLHTREVSNHDWTPMGGETYDEVTEPRGYTGRELLFRVGYVLPLEGNRVVFSLLK